MPPLAVREFFAHPSRAFTVAILRRLSGLSGAARIEVSERFFSRTIAIVPGT